MWIQIVLLVMALAIVALAVFTYTLLLQIRDLNLAVDVSRLAFRDRFKSVEGRLDTTGDRLDHQGEFITKLGRSYLIHDESIKSLEVSRDNTISSFKDQIELDKLFIEKFNSIEFNQKLHSQQIKCIKVMMWD